MDARAENDLALRYGEPLCESMIRDLQNQPWYQEMRDQILAENLDESLFFAELLRWPIPEKYRERAAAQPPFEERLARYLRGERP